MRDAQTHWRLEIKSFKYMRPWTAGCPCGVSLAARTTGFNGIVWELVPCGRFPGHFKAKQAKPAKEAQVPKLKFLSYKSYAKVPKLSS
jgi:hypothetical protein